MIRASNWRPLERNTPQGFMTLHLNPCRLTIHECTYHRSASGSEWVGLPGPPHVGKDGQQRKYPANGKPLYQPIVKIKGKEQRHRFQTAAVTAVRTLVGATGAAG